MKKRFMVSREEADAAAAAAAAETATAAAGAETDPTEGMTEEEVGQELAAADTDAQSADTLADQADDAEETTEVLAKMDEAETPEEKVEIATEHLMRKLGLDKTVSMESIGNERVSKALVIAEEGIFGRIGHSFKRTFTSFDRLEKNLVKLKSDVPAELKGGVLIKDPGWGRVLNQSHKKLMSGADVLSAFKSISDTVNSSEYKKFLKISSNSAIELSKQISKGGILADSDAVQKIYDELDSVKKEFDKLQEMATFRQRSFDPDFKSANSKECNSLLSASEALFSSSFQQGLRDYNAAINVLNTIYYENAQRRIMGVHAADMRAARQVISLMNRYIAILNSNYMALAKATYSVQEYIRKSIKLK